MSGTALSAPAASPALAVLQRMRAAGGAGAAPGAAGEQADALMKLRTAVDMIQTALPGLVVGSEAHTAAVKAIQALSKHLPQGAPVAGVQQTQLADLARNLARNAILQRLIAQRGGTGAPLPSSPMPGA